MLPNTDPITSTGPGTQPAIIRSGLNEIVPASVSLARAEARHDATIAPPVADANERYISRLDAHISTCWEAARNAKESDAQVRILEDLRQREGIYEADKLAAIRAAGGSEIFMMLTSSKCRGAESWVRDVILIEGERPFGVGPTPVPDLPDDIKAMIFGNTMAEMQMAVSQGAYPSPQQTYERARQMRDQAMNQLLEEAKVKASRMEDKIDDVYIEGQFYEALDDMIVDLIGTPAAFIKGPVIRKESRITWEQNPKTGKFEPQVADELTPMFYSPSPLDMYPAPDSKGIQDGFICEKIPLRRAKLFAMIGVPGYSEVRIRAALDEYERNGTTTLSSMEQSRKDLEGNRNWQTSPDKTLEAIEFHGSVKGSMLLEWGMTRKEGVTDKDADYEITALRVGRFVVRAVIKDDPLGRRPYEMASYDKIKGAFWGKSLPRLIADLQAMCNACARAISNNMGLASGPMVEAEMDRLAEGEDPTVMYPWRVFQTKSSKTTSPGPAIRFHNVSQITGPLLEVYRYFSGLADQYSGIPSYEQGINPLTGAAGTAAGLSMLMGAASRQAKRLVAGVDRMIKGMTQRVHTHIMLYDEDESVKGDAIIKAKGAASLMVKEQQQVRRMEFLQQTLNPVDTGIMGPTGRLELLRQAASTLDLDVDKVLPTEDALKVQQMQQALAAAQMAMPPGGGQPGAAPGPAQHVDQGGRRPQEQIAAPVAQ